MKLHADGCEAVLQHTVPQPVGTQLELTCIPNEGFEISWSVTLPGDTAAINTETLRDRPLLINRGIMAEVSTPDDPQPPLTINGTLENSQTMVQCVAVNPSRSQRCSSTAIVVTFFGKHC